MKMKADKGTTFSSWFWVLCVDLMLAWESVDECFLVLSLLATT